MFLQENKQSLLNECLADFKAETGYNFLEILTNKKVRNSFTEEDKKKDLSEYTNNCYRILDDVEEINRELVTR